MRVLSDWECNLVFIRECDLVFFSSNDPDLVQAFLKKWWVESDFKAPNLPLSLRLKGSVVTITVFITILEQNR
jgi:hypothetical protein